MEDRPHLHLLLHLLSDNRETLQQLGCNRDVSKVSKVKVLQSLIIYRFVFSIIFSQRCLQEAVMAFKNSPRSILRARSQLRKIRCVHVFLLISSLFHFTFAFLMFCISLYMNKTAAHGMVSLASLLARYHQIHHQLFDFLMLCLFHFLLLRPPEMIL